MATDERRLSRRGLVNGLAVLAAGTLLGACQITRTVPSPKKQSFPLRRDVPAPPANDANVNK